MIKWLKNRMLDIAIATARVEKSALNNSGVSMTDDVGHTINHKQGTLSDALIRGELTQEVKNLRWRMYKTLMAMEDVNQVIVGYEKMVDPETGETYDSPIMGEGVDGKVKLRKVPIDTYDDYPIHMIIENTETNNGIAERLKQNGSEVLKTHRKVEVECYEMSRFPIHEFLKKINVRLVDEGKYLVEMCFSKYHDGYSPTHALFIKEMERAFARKKIDNLFELKQIGFITHNDMGVKSYKGFLYNVDNFDKFVEFNGMYVVKYMVTAEHDGLDVFEQYRVEELDAKYEAKEIRDSDLQKNK